MTEHHLEFLSLKGAAQLAWVYACQNNLTSRLIYMGVKKNRLIEYPQHMIWLRIIISTRWTKHGRVNQLFQCLISTLYSLIFWWSFMICIVVLWLTYLKFLYPWNLWEVCKCWHILFTSCCMHMLCKLISVCLVWTRVILNTARCTSYPEVVTSVLTHLSKFTPSAYQNYMQRQFHGKSH